MGQDQSCSQQPPVKLEPSSLQCFHNFGNTDADLALLREEGIWLGEELATQFQEEQALPANLSLTDQFSNYAAYEERPFYCEYCRQSGFQTSYNGGFPTRCIQKDSRVVRVMDIQHEDTQIILALGGLRYCPESRNVCFGFLNKDGSINPKFRVTAVFGALVFTAHGSDGFVLRPPKRTNESKKQRRLRGLQDVLPESDVKSDAQSATAVSLPLKENINPNPCRPLRTPSIASVSESLNHAYCEISPRASIQQTVLPPIVSAPAQATTQISSASTGSRTSSMENENAETTPLTTAPGDTQPTILVAGSTTSIMPPNPHFTVGSLSEEHNVAAAGPTRVHEALTFPRWHDIDESGVDMGIDIIIGNRGVRVYPIQLTFTSRPLWFCPEHGCQRHFDERHKGPSPYQRIGDLRNHSRRAHMSGPIPSSEVFVRAESASAIPNPVRPIAPKTASVDSCPAASPTVRSAVDISQPISTSQNISDVPETRHRTDPDSIFGSEDEEPYEPPPANAYISPSTCTPLPNSYLVPPTSSVEPACSTTQSNHPAINTSAISTQESREVDDSQPTVTHNSAGEEYNQSLEDDDDDDDDDEEEDYDDEAEIMAAREAIKEKERLALEAKEQQERDDAETERQAEERKKNLVAGAKRAEQEKKKAKKKAMKAAKADIQRREAALAKEARKREEGREERKRKREEEEEELKQKTLKEEEECQNYKKKERDYSGA